MLEVEIKWNAILERKFYFILLFKMSVNHDTQREIGSKNKIIWEEKRKKKFNLRIKNKNTKWIKTTFLIVKN
jgi:hypothetical protein